MEVMKMRDRGHNYFISMGLGLGVGTRNPL